MGEMIKKPVKNLEILARWIQQNSDKVKWALNDDG